MTDRAGFSKIQDAADGPISIWIFIALAVTFGAQAMGSMIVYAPGVLAPVARGDIGVSASSAGVMTSICYLGCFLATFFSGQVIARVGPLRCSQFSLVIMALGTALTAAANILLVVLGGLILGIGYGALTPTSSAILVKRAPLKMRATILSIKQTGVPAGGILAGGLIPLLILAFHWKVTVLILAGACALLAALIQPTRAEFDGGDTPVSATARQSPTASLRMLWENGRLREVSMVSFMYGGMQMMFVSFFVVYLTQHAGLTLVKAGGAMAAGMIAGVLARVLWGVVADRLVKPRILLALVGFGTSAATVAMAMITPGWHLLAVYAVGIAMGATSIAWNGVYLAEIARVAPQGDIGTATSASLMFNYGGVVLFPSLCWAIIRATGSYTSMFLLMAALNALTALVLLRRRT